jgi:metallo-beta-lactamase class B
MKRVLLLVWFTLLVVAPSPASPPEWSRAFPPFRIGGNLFYVGSEELAAYLVVTPSGHILINANMQSSVDAIKASIERLGFDVHDVKIMLISHAHFDHAGGCAALQKMTGARLEVMDGDVATIESGGRKDFQFARDETMWFPPAHVDRVLHDGDKVELGGSVLTAHKTAGHTPGTTTWTMDLVNYGKTSHAVIVGSPNVLDSYRLVGNTAYPHIADDFKHQFTVLESLPCDVFLGAHGSYFGLEEKYQRWKADNEDYRAFIDPAGYRAYVKERKQAFEKRLRAQRKR